MVFTGGEFEPGELAQFILKAIRSDQHLPPNPGGCSKLREATMLATKAPLPQKPREVPKIAGRISGKRIKLAGNTLGLEELTLKFNGSPEARVELLVSGHHEHFAAGLDRVERFFSTSLIQLPAASKGQWLDDHTFVLTINLIGGINFYTIRITIPDEAKKVDVVLSERTGLNAEQFEGVLSD